MLEEGISVAIKLEGIIGLRLRGKRESDGCMGGNKTERAFSFSTFLSIAQISSYANFRRKSSLYKEQRDTGNTIVSKMSTKLAKTSK